jgi:hypothetical protein
LNIPDTLTSANEGSSDLSGNRQYQGYRNPARPCEIENTARGLGVDIENALILADSTRDCLEAAKRLIDVGEAYPPGTFRDAKHLTIDASLDRLRRRWPDDNLYA